MLEKIDERTNLGPILNGPFLLNLCHSKNNNLEGCYKTIRMRRRVKEHCAKVSDKAFL